MSSSFMLRNGSGEYELSWSIDSPGATPLPLNDPTSALYFLREFITDSGRQHDFRLWLLDRNSYFEMYAIDDDRILSYAAELIVSRELIIAGSGEGGANKEAGEGGDAATTSGSGTSKGIMRKSGEKAVLRSSVVPTPLQDELNRQQTPPEEQTPVEEPDAETTWIEIELLDANGNPVSGERFKITMPDGSTQYGRLDSEGKARIERLQPGSCQVTFPDRDQEIWTVG